MKTTKFKNSKHFIILALLLLGFARQTGYSQEPHTPYPIIFVHGLVGNKWSWNEDQNFDDIIENLQAAGLTLGGNIEINLNATRNINQYASNKENDVLLSDPGSINKGDFYIINFDVHSELGYYVDHMPISEVDEMVLPLKSDNCFKVTNINNFRVGDIIRVDHELMEVTHVYDEQICVNRGIWGTIFLFSKSITLLTKNIYNLSTQGNQSSIVKQGYGLKLAIEKIKDINTGVNKVILVGHSMGGLACREFIRSHYNNDVAKIVTIGTPHKGSDWANSDLAQLFPISVKGIDLHSDAIRDLDPASVFLFGGSESSISNNYYSRDVNCNGILNEWIVGLNQDYNHLDEIARTWIVSKFNPIGGDLVVSLESQRLSVYDTLMTNRPHITISDVMPGETKDEYSLIRGLDEPNEKELAYEIKENSTNKGFITFQRKNVEKDVDLYKITLSKSGHLKINLTADSPTGVKEIDLFDNDLNPMKLVPGINQTIDELLTGNLPPVIAGAGIIEMDLESGTYYIQIIGKASENTYQNPYVLQTEFAPEVLAALSVSPGSLQYYDVVVNSPKEKLVTLTNNGEANLLITSIGLSGADADQFSAAPMPPFSVSTELSQNVTLTFNPTSSGAKLVSLEITTNREDIPVKTVSLKGNGVDHETKVLVCSPIDTYNYGNTKVSTSKNKIFTLQNTGSNTCTISELVLEGISQEEYTITTPTVIPFDLGTGETKQITVRFSPTSIGVKNATLIIANNSDNLSPKHSIELYGNGTENFYSGNNNTLVAYEYWFDDQYGNKVITPVQPIFETSLVAKLPTNELNIGLHSLHIRHKDKKGRWSSIASEFFHKLPATTDSSRTIIACEYWFDDDFANKVSTEITPGQTITTNEGFDVSSLTNGLHSYHVRYKDNADQWSSVVSEFFHKLPASASGERKITTYEHWYDNDYAGKTNVSVTPEQVFSLNGGLDAVALSTGLHSYHVRYKDDAGQWSSVVSEFFHKLPVSSAQDNLITSYRYWFNHDEENIQFINLATPVNTYELIRDISVSGLPSGDNTIHFQFMDTRQAWSSVVTDTFNMESLLVQEVALKTGWNIFSVKLQPATPDLKVLSQNLIDDGSLVKIQDEAGNSLEDWGIFGGWQNNIGNISPTEGYKIKVNRNDTIKVSGNPVEYPFAIPLKTGWNIAGYPQLTDFSGMNLVQQLLDKGTLIKVQDEGGNSIEDWGIFGGWQNNIGNFRAGEGYKIKVNAKDTLWIYENYPKSVLIAPKTVATTHFVPGFKGNGVDHMNINLVGLPLNILHAGDELAVFDGVTCVGAVTLQSQHLQNEAVSIAASATDNLGIAGFGEGNPFVLRMWNSKQNQEFNLEPDIISGTSTFAKHETTVASLEKYATTGLDGIPGSDINEINCYPNPFKNEVTVEINLFKESEVEVEVFNQLGQKVRKLAAGEQLNRGIHRIVWDGTNAGNGRITSGIYNVRLKIDDAVYYRKVIYSK